MLQIVYATPINVNMLTPHECYKFPCSEVLTNNEGGLYVQLKGPYPWGEPGKTFVLSTQRIS
jgi:hypothetical protein